MRFPSPQTNFSPYIPLSAGIRGIDKIMHERGAEVGIIKVPPLDGMRFRPLITEETGGDGVKNDLHEIFHVQGPTAPAVETGMEPEG